MKSLIITEIVQGIGSEGAWGELQARGGRVFPGAAVEGVYETDSSFIWCRGGCWFGRGGEGWGLDYNCMRFRGFPDLS